MAMLYSSLDAVFCVVPMRDVTHFANNIIFVNQFDCTVSHFPFGFRFAGYSQLFEFSDAAVRSLHSLSLKI